ncbi:TonB-dependent receptor [Chitinophaga parva]|uniref:TonB-dependent receptor n=1 Tax=Chitinophaga parva TaxID=2169414 RepID=A0A2T7BCU2_9BACT|nr:outer membrane beta-barrel protein [Chitinophaga parva]PUZ22923.1 TonB-dependent receptor [Chitinophaga parva]
MQMKNVVLLTISLLMPVPLLAQTITGQVKDAQQQPAMAATIVLVRHNDSSVVKATLPDNSGRFSFEAIAAGTYRLWVTMMGYKKYRSESFVFTKGQALTLPAITLQQQDAQLKEVSVTAQKPFIERKIDRTVVNVDALISNAGSNALEVLEKSPGISVEDEQTISLKGKNNVTIYIDDRPTYLSGTALQNYLRSLPASTIESVEIMTNPPAKYDAAGTGGVINIRTKRSRQKGFNGGLNLSAMQGIYFSTNNSFNFNYRNNKWNIGGNVAYNKARGYSDLTINRQFYDEAGQTQGYFMQHNQINRWFTSFSGKISADYYATEKSTFGIVLSGDDDHPRSDNDNISHLLDGHQQLDSSIHALNSTKGTFNNVGLNLNYRHAYDKNGRELTADADYIRYNTGSQEVYNNYSYLPDATDPYLYAQLNGQVPTHIDIYSGKLDYTHPFRNGYKLAAGVKSSYTATDNIAQYYNLVDGQNLPDYDKSNHFRYRENINAAYLNLNKDFKRLSVQAGLRFENTVSNGHQLGNAVKGDSAFNRNYTGLFPTLYLLYKLDTAANNTLSLNYGRRIDRPYYQDLNPFISPLDKFTYYVGNPYVKPSYTQRVELGHSYKGRISTTFIYTHSRDDINETIEIVNGIYYSRPGNIGATTTLEVDLDVQQDLGKRLNLHFYGEAGNIHSYGDFYAGHLDSRGNYVFVMPTLTLKLPKDWTIQASARYRSKLTHAQFVLGERGAVDLGFSKKITPKLLLKLNGSDLFKTMINTGVINNLAMTTANWRNVSDTRKVALSISYNFGKTIANQRRHEDNSADSERNRVKQ